MKTFLATGFLGGLSTFSSFSCLETVNLYNAGNHILAIGNVMLNMVLSIAGVVFGMFIAKPFRWVA